MAQILIIDNDRSVGAAMDAMLRSAGHTPVFAPDAKTGLDALDASNFDLAFVDMLMPDMDGVEAIRQIHQKKADLLVIAMTGFRLRNAAFGAADPLDAAERAGAAFGLRKPFTRQELLSAANILKDLATAGAGGLR